MPEVSQKRQQRTTTASPKRYVHLIGGDAGGRRHEPGDPVDPATPDHKITEWLKAGVIKKEKKKK